MERKKVQRGEIYIYDFGKQSGSLQSGERPVLIVQCEDGNIASNTTVIAAISSVVKNQYMPTHILLGDRFGLRQPSMVMLEQLRTINQNELGRYVGIVDDEEILNKTRKGLMSLFALWKKGNNHKKADIRCLCPKCLGNYLASDDFLVKRMNPLQKSKEKCDKCEGLGYDYILMKRKGV